MSLAPNTATMSAFTTSRGDQETRAQVRVWIAFALLGAGLYAQQFVTLGKLKRALLERAPGDPVNSLAGKAWGVLLHSWSIFTSPADLLITAVIVGAVGYLLWSEITDHTLTDLFDRADTSNRVLYGFLALATVVITRCYWTRGQVFMGDAETHMLRSWMFVEHFRHLDTPVWSNAWYGGFPLLENYSAFYFMATALLTMLFRGDIHTATKLLLWSCHAGSVFVMFWYLRTATRRRLPSLIGAMAYGLSFFRLHILLYQGDLQVAVVFLLCPLLLLVTERYFENRSSARTTFVLATSTLALLIFNHHGYAFFVLVLYVIYLVARLAVTPVPFWDRFKVLVMFGFAEVASLFMNAFLLGPFLFAPDEFHGMQNSAFPLVIPNLRAPVMLVKLFRWSALGDGSSLGYIGLSVGVLAVIGSIYALRRRQPAGVGVFACMVAALLMTHNHGSYNVKNVDFFLIFICAITAWAPIAIVETRTRLAFIERARLRWADRFPAHVAVICLGVMLVDLGPTTFQSVFRENYEFKQPMYEKVLALDGPFKLIERQVLTHDPSKPPNAYFDPNKIGVPSAYAATRTPLGFFHEGAGLSFGYTAEIVKNLHRDLNENRISPTTAAGLYLVGVKYVVFRDRYRWFTSELPRSALYRIDADGILQFSHASPLLLSRRVIGTTDVPGYPATDLIRQRHYFDPQTFDYAAPYFRDLVQPLLTTIRPDLERGVASTLITRDGDVRQDLGSSEELKSEVVAFASDLKHVTVRYRSNVDAFGQVPYNYFPYLDVRVDDKPTSFYRSAMNHILLPLPAGEHVIAIHGIISPLQERLLWLSLVATIAVIVVPRRLFSSLPHFNS
jgi:hypothetical protein